VNYFFIIVFSVVDLFLVAPVACCKLCSLLSVAVAIKLWTRHCSVLTGWDKNMLHW